MSDTHGANRSVKRYVSLPLMALVFLLMSLSAMCKAAWGWKQDSNSSSSLPDVLLTLHPYLGQSYVPMHPGKPGPVLERIDPKLDLTPTPGISASQGSSTLPSSKTVASGQPQIGQSMPGIGGAQVIQSAQSNSGTNNPSNSPQGTTGAGGWTMGGGSDQFNMFDHSKPSNLWISGQVNMITQYKPHFPSKYSGPNSFNNFNEGKTSIVTDLFLAYRILPRLEAFLNVERFDGAGLSSALGLGGLTNLDAIRNGPSLRGKFFIARLGLHATIPLSKKLFDAERSPANLQTKLPERRIEFRAGAFSAADFFNYNTAASDTHHQFMNWAVCNDGWWDFPSDTRGYTWGGEVEYQSPRFAARFLEAAMPIVANGESLVWRPSTTHSENYELEFRRKFILNRPGIVRLLAFENHANMGNYQQSINDFYAGFTSTPIIQLTVKPGTVKYGFGFNYEQELANGVTGFLRTGFNNGTTETYVFTEVDNTLVLGVAFDGARWRRRGDKIGVAMLTNGLSRVHANYLRLGGLGFDLGDGGLNYARENECETYYTCHLWKGLYFGPDIQYIINPGYNRARGPAAVFSMRLHVDI